MIINGIALAFFILIGYKRKKWLFFYTDSLGSKVFLSLNMLFVLLNVYFIITALSQLVNAKYIHRPFLILVEAIVLISINLGNLYYNNESKKSEEDLLSVNTNSYSLKNKKYLPINIYDSEVFISIKDIPLRKNVNAILQGNKLLANYLKYFLKYKVSMPVFKGAKDITALSSSNEVTVREYLENVIGKNNIFCNKISKYIAEFNNQGNDIHQLNLDNTIDELQNSFLVSKSAFNLDQAKNSIRIPELGLLLEFPSSQNLTLVDTIEFIKEKSEYKLEIDKS